MTCTTADERRRLESLAASDLEAHQLARFNALLAAILPANKFYAEKLAGVSGPLASLDELSGLPYTFKEDLLGQRHHLQVARNRTYPLEVYTRFHQTSGTRGRPLVVLDTADDWQWWIECWQYVLDAAEIVPSDRVFLAFSFGPFVGFWSAHDAAVHRGCLVIPGGGMNTLGRVELIRATDATVLLCTPSYALHLAETAQAHQIDTTQLEIRKIILAGEPGGSVPATRERIAQAWNAKVFDHSGATEVGPWGYADRAQRGLHVNEAQFIAEFLSVESGKPAGEGELAELVLTNLGRAGSPVIRYRTGDLVRPSWQAAGDNRFVLLDGGILGRSDDMLIVRGVNIFPSAVEQIVRSFPEVLEYRIVATKQGQMDQLSVEIEDRLDRPDRVAQELRLRLGLKVEVQSVPIGSLPRFEGKGKRFVDQR